MANFLSALQSGRVLLMDGAMGTELRRAGLKDNECGELWNLTQPEKVRAIHQAYVDAGAEVLVSNTFQANRKALAKYDLQNRSDEVYRASLAAARSVAGPDRFVVADIGPMDDATDIREPKSVEHLVPEFGSADAIMLETFSDALVFFLVQHCRLACWSEKVPFLVSLAYQRLPSGQLCTRDRHPPEWFAMQARQYQIAALGVNCGRDMGMDEIIEIIRRYRQVTDLPLFARPNAGTPTRVGDRWVYPHTPEKMAARLPELLEAGVSMIGGCCGTTPEHIAAFRPIIEKWNVEADTGEPGA